MKILQVLHQFLPDHIGGIEVYVRNLSQKLQDSGMEVLLFFGDGVVLCDPSENRESIDGLRSIHIHDSDGPQGKRFSFFQTFRNPAVLKSFEQAVNEFQPDVIHFHHTMYLSGELISLAKRLGIPVVITIHDFWFLCHKLHLVDSGGNQCNGPLGGGKCAFCFLPGKQGLLGCINAFLCGIPLAYRTRYQLRVLRSADLLATPAAFVQGILERYLGGGHKIRHVPYGISTSNVFRSSKPRSDNIRFGYLGTIKPHKGIHVLIDAFNGLVHEKACLNIYGDTGTDESYSLDMIKNCQNGRVNFRGTYDNQDVDNILKDVDVVVVPSIWRETGPLVVLEALANGKPVVASNLGGMAEMIHEGENGFLFVPGDSGSLLRRIRAILERPSILAELNVCLKPEHHIDHNVKAMLNLYEKLV